ncbi:MAG: class I SAM-dependent methyltransferase [Candidatus Electrothrix sp. GW3-4]|uniref:class I SAM-dependent methyltransferase n=1 Tax=Candidatus Electrothrix sp. GW3-4 TaxID=3126740 RepID=UPI0030D1CFFE
MKELYNNYYEEGFSLSKSQGLDLKSFELVARKYRWNYQRFFSSLPKNAKILDVGCGLGQFLFYLRKDGFSNTTGIDMSSTQIELALKMQPDVDFRHVVDSVDFCLQHEEKYDVVTMNDVLEHIEKEHLISFLQALYRSLKPNGLIIVKTINSACPLSHASRYLDLTHTISFHEKSLTQLFRHVGFVDIHCYQEEIGVYNLLFALKKSIVVAVRFFLRIMIYFSECDWQRIISVNLIACGKK